MARSISLLPEQLDLALYAGDGAVLRFTVTDEDDAPVPLDGEVLAQIRKKRSDPEPLATFTPDMSDGATGVVVLSLSGQQTTDLAAGAAKFSGVWDCQLTATDAEPVTLFQGKVECSLDVSRD